MSDEIILQANTLLRIQGRGLSWKQLKELEAAGTNFTLSNPFQIAREEVLKHGTRSLLGSVIIQEDVMGRHDTPLTVGDVVARLLSKVAPAQQVDFCDPYALAGGTEPEQQAARLAEVLEHPLKRAEKLVIHYEKSGADTKQSIIELLGEQVELEFRKNKKIHDRFALLDGAAGVIFGSSLNGIGKKYFLVDSLRPEDAKEFARVLSETSAAPDSRSAKDASPH